MKYDELNPGKIVRMNPKLVQLLKVDPNMMGTVPVGESFGCILYIDRKDQYSVRFSCAGECGSHSTDEVCFQDYEEWSEKLGSDFFIHSSVNEYFMTQPKPEPLSIRDLYEFTLEEETENVLKILSDEVSG